MRRATHQQRVRHDLMSMWRGVEDGPLLDCPTQTLGALIPIVMSGWKLDDKLRQEDVAAAWSELVGTFIAKQTAPDGFKRSVLTVRVLQPAVHHTLMMQKGLLLKKLQDRFGKDTVRNVKFRHG